MAKRIRLLSVVFILVFETVSLSAVPVYAYYNEPVQKNKPEIIKSYTIPLTKAACKKFSTYAPNTADSSIAAPEKNKQVKAENQETLWYSKALALKKEHQKVLWDFCKSRKLDYIDMLALIYTESNFNEKCSNGVSKGYFQISKTHFDSLSKTLKTPNKPLDGKININWGTAMYSWILKDKRVKDLQGKKKRDVALSIFNRGTGGYDRYGINNRFLKVYYKKRDIVCSCFKK
ncbi:MAG: lytic transglycosylase domain-containing protein [Clostridia bacterium]|nr:lytic transglycosylase domain-containing protein [Clostridia bacterium]